MHSDAVPPESASLVSDGEQAKLGANQEAANANDKPDRDLNCQHLKVANAQVDGVVILWPGLNCYLLKP